jgi:hypothetical protein
LDKKLEIIPGLLDVKLQGSNFNQPFEALRNKQLYPPGKNSDLVRHNFLGSRKRNERSAWELKKNLIVSA